MNVVTRRTFVASLTQAAVGLTLVPRHVLGGPGHLAPSDRVNLAVIGAGGMGAANAEALVAGGQRIVALADIDFVHVDRTVQGRLRNAQGERNPAAVQLQEAYATAKRYDDFRVMLDEERRNIDAVAICTPDHTHAVAAKQAMELGKHVYVQKPLSYTVHEARVLRATADRTGVVTQMGNQGRTISADARRVNEWVQAGVIGAVREVHVWTNRPIWPQGLPRPTPGTGEPSDVDWRRDVPRVLARALGGSHPLPRHVKWDLFLGPAPWVEYHPMYHPFNWRGWVDWGVGALGDMGAHLIDHPYWALGLGYPSSVEATSTPWGGDPTNPVTYPLAMTAHYEFPARQSQPPLRLSWYDGGLLPPRPQALPDEVRLDQDWNGGAYYVGEKGVLLHGMWGANPQLYPEDLSEEAARVPQRSPRLEVSHEMNWIQAIRGEAEATSPFSYAAPLTELMLLGLVALRTGQGTRIYYDGEAGRVTHPAEANRYLHREYRNGWEL
jgi:predicted dehydrogenase